MSPKLRSQVDDLESNFSESLHIDNTHESDGDDISDVEEEGCEELEPNPNHKHLYKADGDDISDVEEEGCEELEPNPNHKHLYKAATFPRPGEMLSSIAFSDEEDDEEHDSEDPITRSISLPTPLKSAMKGSREKQGASPKMLTVTWAPDVYDPLPNSLSHAVKGKQKKQPKNNDNYKKKNGKKGQKGNFSKGGGGSSSGSSKKQFRKIGGSSDRCYKSLDARDRVVDPYDEGDFDVGSPDPYCGSSFLKKSSNKMHYAVAEAL